MNDRSDKMLYSPEKNIPLGEAIMLADGRPALRVKHKSKRNQIKYEDVPLDYICTGTLNAAARRHLQDGKEPQLVSVSESKISQQNIGS